MTGVQTCALPIYAMHPEHACAVGYRSAGGDSRQFSDPGQCLEVDVCLGWRDSIFDAGRDDGKGAVKASMWWVEECPHATELDIIDRVTAHDH